MTHISADVQRITLNASGKGVCGGAKILAPPYYTQCGVCISSERFFFILSVCVVLLTRATFCDVLFCYPCVLFLGCSC